MADKVLRVAALIILSLSTCLSLAILATAADVLATYNTEKDSNPWWLPIWPQHFDSKGLETLISVSAAVAALDVLAGVLLWKTVS